MGGVCTIVYVFTLLVFMLFAIQKDIVAATSGGGNRDITIPEIQIVNSSEGRLLRKFPHHKLTAYLGAICTVLLADKLGNFDDVFDIKWRHKFPLPALMSIPILVVYFLTFGVTTVVVPKPLQEFGAPETFDIGWLYYAYMALLSIFSSNCINILAGVNGIEVGQSVVVAVLLLLNDWLYVFYIDNHPATEAHLFSIYLLLPFLGVSLALLWHNWFPAEVFVGDTYCYFAGMVFAVVSILGHFSKTLLLLLIPQILNFVYSAPQIFKLLPCPRHRLPKFNAKTGLMGPSVTEWEKPPGTLPTLLLETLDRFFLIKLVRNPKGQIVQSSNLTIINLWLVWRGPMREDRLTTELLCLQAACGVFGLFARHSLASLLFWHDNFP